MGWAGRLAGCWLLAAGWLGGWCLRAEEKANPSSKKKKRQHAARGRGKANRRRRGEGGRRQPGRHDAARWWAAAASADGAAAAGTAGGAATLEGGRKTAADRDAGAGRDCAVLVGGIGGFGLGGGGVSSRDRTARAPRKGRWNDLPAAGSGSRRRPRAAGRAGGRGARVRATWSEQRRVRPGSRRRATALW